MIDFTDENFRDEVRDAMSSLRAEMARVRDSLADINYNTTRPSATPVSAGSGEAQSPGAGNDQGKPPTPPPFSNLFTGIENFQGLSERLKTETENASRFARDLRSATKDIKSGDARYSSVIDQSKLPALIEEIEKKKDALVKEREGTELGTERDEALKFEIQGTEEIVKALESLKNATQENTSKIPSKVSQTIAALIGSLGVSQYIMTRMVSQPYQYQTQPALGAMANTGAMGEVLSQAYGARESVLQEYRTMGVSGLAGLGGISGAAVGSRFGGIGKAGGAVLGAGIGAVSGALLQDPIAEFLAGDMDTAAFEASLGKSILDPQKYVENFFRPTLQARMGLGLEGNIVGQLGGFASSDAQSLGYNAVMVGEVMGQYLSTLSPSLAPTTEEQATGLIDATAGLEGFGMGKDMIFSIMSDISRSGSQDYQKSLNAMLMATSEDGQITNYTANVLVPALSKVIESRSIQNIAKSSEEVTKEAAGLFSFFKNSDTNIGKMLSANPEMMSQVFGILDQVGAQAIQDPALMLYLNRMGLSFSDVVTGDPRALMMPLQSFAGMAQYDAGGDINLDSAASISSIMGFLTATGIGVSTGSFNIVAEMMSAVNKGGTVNMADIQNRLMEADPQNQMYEAFKQLADRLDAIAGTDGGGRQRELVEQANTMFGLMEENVDTIGTIQGMIKDVLSDTERMNESITLAGAEIVRKFADMAGINNVEEMFPALFEAEDIVELNRLSRIVGENASIPAEDAKDILNVLESSTYTDAATFFNNIDLAKVTEDQISQFNSLIEKLREEYSVLPNTPEILATFPHYEAVMSGGDALSSLLLPGLIFQDVPDEMKKLFNFGYAVGGYTGAGGRLDPVGVVHGGEYVISDNNVPGNIRTLHQMQSGVSFDEMRGIFSSDTGTGFAVGGYTGAGGRLDPVGVVHGGEYVISDNNVPGNIRTLQQMESGVSFDEMGGTSSSGDTIRVYLEFSNTNPDAIIQAAKSSARQMLIDERLI